MATAAAILTQPDTADDRRRALRLAATAIRARLRLPPRLSLSEWSDAHRVLSPEASAQPGRWKTEKVPYLREIMDTISGREYQDITVVKCSQSAGSEAILNACGYYMDQEPCSILVIQPNVKPMGEAFSKSRIAPMIRDCARLRGKVKDPRARDSGNTIMQKSYPGGTLFIMGANSPAGLASNPIRVVLADELDRWPSSAGTEGDPLSLADARQITYLHRKKKVKVSSPGNEGESRIEKEWNLSDQRHYHVPCPHCGEKQALEWRDSEGKPGIKPGRGKYRLMWEKEGDGDDAVHKPDTAAYLCIHCACLIDESSKPWMLANGEWVKHNPASSRAGFHISGLLSPWVRWREIATRWLEVKGDDERMKTFFNTLLGLLFVHAGEEANPDKLKGRRAAYAAEVPSGVALLTAGIDVQGDRIEVEVRGWGANEESWQIRLERLHGDPEGDDVWQRAEEILTRPWKHESGATLRIRACMVDSGYSQDAVFRFVRPRQTRGVFASKGAENAKVPLSRATRANRDGVKTFTINPNVFKDVLFSRLRKTHAGPGYLHFGTEAQTGTPDDYFTQFGAERRKVEWVDLRPVVSYENPQQKRNEAIDLYVLTLAALRSLGLTTSQRLGQMAGTLQAEGEKQRAAEAATDGEEPTEPTPAPAPQTRTTERRSFRDGRKGGSWWERGR